MSQAQPIKPWSRGSLRRNARKLFKQSGLSGPVTLFMVVCVITPTIIIQNGFTVMAAWEMLLTVLLCLSLRMTSER